jgi:hypothetical protein
MPIPPSSESCIRLDITIPDFRWRMPWGRLDIEYNGLPIPADVVGSLIARANAALLPLVPIFDLVDAIIGVIALFDAIKSLNAYDIRKELEKWMKIASRFYGYLPPALIPVFLKDSVWVIILFLRALRSDLEAIIVSQSTIDLAGQRAQALGLADLDAVVTCSQANLDLQLELLAKSNAEPLARFIGLVNYFADLAGLPQIPAIQIDGTATEALAQVDVAIEQLEILHAKLPG